MLRLCHASRKTPAVAFQVLHNGRTLCIAGLRGKPGVITTTLHSVDRGSGPRLSLHIGGLESTDANIVWALRELTIGDEAPSISSKT